MLLTLVLLHVLLPGLEADGSSAAHEWKDLESYMTNDWNKELVERLVDDFEPVYPFQMRDRSRVGIDTRNYLFENITIHFEQCTFLIKTSYGRLKLHVQLNDVLIPNGATYKRYLSAESVTEAGKRSIPNCLYQGQVHGHPQSQVALSTCHGLRGFISFENSTYLIVPLKGGDLSRRHPHLFMRMKIDEEVLCANSDKTEWSRRGAKHRTLHRKRLRRDIEREIKFIELRIFADKNLVQWLGQPYADTFLFFLEAINIVDLMYQQLNTRLSIVHAELWQSVNRVEVQQEVVPSLLNFVQFLSVKLDSVQSDVSLLLSAAELTRAETMAVSDSACTARAAGVVKIADRFQPFYAATLIAHAIGHMVGMGHDDSELGCADISDFISIMSNVYSARRTRKVYRFTECSKRDFLALLNSGQRRCLFNFPMEDDALRKCGNGVVDPGEQCDCGSLEECDSVDPCCDAVTCMLRADAECARGPCCDSCKLVSTRKMCRASEDPNCDVPEYCTGVSGQCPADSYRPDGSTCGPEHDGYCFGGRCRRAETDCQKIWGQQSTVADEACFRKFNTLGIDFGHCGVDNRGRPIACSDSDYNCGLLFCKGGTDTPSFPFYFKTQFTEDGKAYECKAFIDDKAPVNASLVKDGAKCGPSNLCKSNKCVPAHRVLQPAICPTNNVALHCSGHGVCTNLNKCFCDIGWSAVDCSVKLNISFTSLAPTVISSGDVQAPSVVSVPEQHVPTETNRLDIYAMLIILGCVAVGIFLMLFMLLFCYRRRTKDSKNTKAVDMAKSEFERESNSSTETANRSIRFGPSRTYGSNTTPVVNRRKLEEISENEEQECMIVREESNGHDGSVYGSHAFIERGWPRNRLPSKGILKNGPYTFSSQESKSLLGRGYDGYESEPPYVGSGGLKLTPRRGQTVVCDDSTNIHSAYEGFEDGDRLIQVNCRHLNRTTAAIVSPYLYIKNRSLAKAPTMDSSPYRKAGSTRSEEGTLCAHHYMGSPLLSPRRTSEERSPDGHHRHHMLNSPANSTCSSSRVMAKPKPLKLTNIEYLLKQLENGAKGNGGDSMAVVTTSPGSSAELSLPEADKRVPLEDDQFSLQRKASLTPIINDLTDGHFTDGEQFTFVQDEILKSIQ